VWATDSFDGLPAGVVHLQGDDDYGRPDGTACGASAVGLWFFASRSLDDVPPSDRRQPRALALACWNSASLMTPLSRRSASRAISSAAPPPPATFWT
jgi:hypothetical protein